MKSQRIARMPILLIIFLAVLEVRGRPDYFYEPVIYITKPEQEVKVDGCATLLPLQHQ